MLKSRGTRTAVLAAAIAALTSPSITRAAAVTWNDATPPGNWSDPLNWTGGTGVPVAADTVTFTNVGASNTQGSITNTVDASTTIAGLVYNAQSDLALDNKFHTTEIPTGVTLTLNGNPTTGILGVGLATNAATVYSVFTTVTGAGTLTLNNASATVDVRQGSSAASFTGRSTLDMSNLANFNATVANFRIGNGDGSSTTFNRAAGTVILAANSTITAGTVITGFVSASSGAASQLTLNTTTAINANTIQFGIRKGNGNANFAPTVTGGSLIVRNQAGTGRANLEIAQSQASEVTGTNSNGVLDFTSDGGTNRGGGSVNMLLGNLLIARGNANAGTATQGRATGRLTYDAGIVDANDVTVGEAGNVAGKGTSIGTLEVKGTGQLIVNNNLTLGKNTVLATTTGIPTGTLTIGNTGASASAKIGGALIDGGGTTTVNVIDGSLNAGTIGSVASPLDTLAINNGKLTVNLNTTAASGNITTLTADGTNKLGVNVTGAVTAGVYPIIDYGTLGGVGFGSFSIDKLPARLVATLQDSGSTIDLNVTSFDSPKWTGSINSNWNVNTTSNWQLITAGTATTYQEDLATYTTGDNVRFDNTASTGNVNVATTVAPGSIVIDNTAAGITYNFTGTGAITGGAPLAKSSDGSVTFANTGGNAIGPMTINLGTIRIGDGTTVGGGAGSYASAAVASGSTLAFAPAAGDSLTFAGVISGVGNVTHSGPGKTTLAASNTYTGNTEITAGTVVVTNNNSFGPITGGATPVNVSGTGQIDVAGVTGVSALDFGTNKVFNIAGAGPDGNGAIVNSGVIAQQNAFEKINLTADATIGTTGRLDLRGTDAIRGNLSLNGNTLTKKGAGQFSIVRSDVTDGNINVEAGTLRVETSSNISGSGLLSFAAGSTASFQLITGDISRPMALNGATLTDSNQTAAVVIASPVAHTSTNTYNIQASTGFTFTGALSGTGSITKTGAGKLVLANASNVFTGGLSADVGNIELAQNGAAVINTGPITIASGAKVDIKDNKLISTSPAGSATGGVYDGVQALIQQANSGGTWTGTTGLTTSMPAATSGLTSIGVISAAQKFGLAGGATATFAGQTVTAANTLAMYTYGGDANLDGFISGDDYSAIDFNVAAPGSSGWANGDFNHDGIISGDDYSMIDFNIVAQGAPFSTSGAAAGLSGVTAVPEPASLGMIGLAATALFGRGRRRSV